MFFKEIEAPLLEQIQLENKFLIYIQIYIQNGKNKFEYMAMRRHVVGMTGRTDGQKCD